MDISSENLEALKQLISRDLDTNKLLNIQTTYTTDRRAALKDANYIINLVKIGGVEAFAHDIDIPMKYGISQCVGDTLCAGGIMYAQRNIPYILDLCNDIHEVAAPGALLLNYANPNAINTWVAETYGRVKTVGLCHGVQHGQTLIARVLGIPEKELQFTCLGINHLTWYTKIMHKGQNLCNQLLAAFEKDKTAMREEKVRIDILRKFGYFSTESNGHLSEYLPWYRKNLDKLDDWIDTECWTNGIHAGYLHLCQKRVKQRLNINTLLQETTPLVYDYNHRSVEHASYIIEALETGRIYRGHFNVVNHGAISNLPYDAVIEAPGYVDANGISIVRQEPLPSSLAAVCRTNIDVQRLAIEAGIKGNDQILRQAMLLDPLVGAVCDTNQIWAMVDELLIAEEKYLPQYC